MSSFNDLIRINRLAFVRSMDAAPLVDHLIAGNIFTRDMMEQCAAQVTTSGRNGYILDVLPKRGPNAEPVFVKALIDTNQRHLAALISPSISQALPVAAVKTVRAFRHLADSIANLKPTETTTERSGKVYLTSVSIYSEQDPISSLGQREIPFVFAAKSGLYGKDAILSWPRPKTISNAQWPRTTARWKN